MPLLKMCGFISTSMIPATFCSQADSSLCGQLPYRRWAARPQAARAGDDVFQQAAAGDVGQRAAIGCCCASAANTLFTYSRVGSLTATCLNGCTVSINGQVAAGALDAFAHQRAAVRLHAGRSQAQRHYVAGPHVPGRWMLALFHPRRRRSPQGRYSPGGYMPGIPTPISPPMNAAEAHPAMMPPTTAAAVSTSLPQAVNRGRTAARRPAPTSVTLIPGRCQRDCRAVPTRTPA